MKIAATSREMLCKYTLDAGFEQFFSILEYVCFKRDVAFLKVESNSTSQTCPNCQTQIDGQETSKLESI
jgi:putative transposase